MYGPYLLSPLLLLSAEPLPPAPCQDGCKAHSAQMTMDGAHVLLPDIGADKIWSFDMAAGEITPSPTPFFQAPGGSVRPTCPCCQAAACMVGIRRAQVGNLQGPPTNPSANI